MIEGMEAITTSALGLALDAATLRHQAIATNIANAETPEYEPVTVSFEAQLEDARLSLQSQGWLDASSLSGVVPRLEVDYAHRAFGMSPKVMIDVEMARMSQNAVHFQALVKGLSRHFSILSAAVSDGKK